jgi:multidrug efflux pump subunit AcrA (membrane-fusion protein)
MTANVECEFGLTRPDATTIRKKIPSTSVFADRNGLEFVWLVEEESLTVKAQEIKTGELTEEGVIVLSGLESGSEIVTAGVQFLSEGQKIRYYSAEASK